MQIKEIINPLLKWWWLVVISTLIAAGTSYQVAKPLPPVYLAHTTIMVGRAISDPNPSGNEFGMAQQLAVYYTSIAQREPIRDATKKALNLPELPKYTPKTLPNSPFIEIAVTDTDPNRAMQVANELAKQLISQSPTAPQKEDVERKQFVDQQLAQIQQGIMDTQAAIDKRQQEIPQLSSATEIQDAQAEIAALEDKLSLLQTNYSELLAGTQSGAVNTLSIIESATTPTIPIGPNKTLIIAIAAAAGMALAVGAAYLLEFLDQTIRTPDDVERFFHVPVLGYIAKEKHENLAVLITEQPRSPLADAIRGLRTNLSFVSVDQPLRTLLISSAKESEGKTTIAVSLALSMAQTDKKVTLVDADMRRPSIHKRLNLPLQPGLSDAFQENVMVCDLPTLSTTHPNLMILPAGKIPPNPAELLSSNKMVQIMTDLRDGTDIVIVDGPPLIIPDSAVLASKVDGILLVVQPGQISYSTATVLAGQMHRTGGRLVGVVFNQVKANDVHAYAGYEYYRDYSEESDGKPSWLIKLTKPFFAIFTRFFTAKPKNSQTTSRKKA
jgi:capsular exopolysaccharide synthesis family protein